MKYDAALSVPYYLIQAQRLDGTGWQYTMTCDRADEIPALCQPLVEAYGASPISLTLTYCEPLIYAVPTASLHKYGPAGQREAQRRAAA